MEKVNEKLNIFSLDMVEEEAVDWLLYPYIPYSKLTIIEGDPGEGKTTLILNIIAKMTRGQSVFPYSQDNTDIVMSEEINPITVIYQTAEDGLADTIKPRLMAADADCSRVMVINDSDDPLTISDDRLEQALVETGARLVVLDPIQGFLGSDVDMNRANLVRPLMKHLAYLAETYHCAIVMVGHLNKKGSKTAYRALGSIDFQAAARSVLLVGRTKDDPDTRILCQIKNSLAEEGPSMAFQIDGSKGVTWFGETDVSADELLRGVSHKGDRSKEAVAFLNEILADGRVAVNEVKAEAEKRGIKDKTLRNAKESLGICSEKAAEGWYWKLPDAA